MVVGSFTYKPPNGRRLTYVTYRNKREIIPASSCQPASQPTETKNQQVLQFKATISNTHNIHPRMFVFFLYIIILCIIFSQMKSNMLCVNAWLGLEVSYVHLEKLLSFFWCAPGKEFRISFRFRLLSLFPPQVERWKDEEESSSKLSRSMHSLRLTLSWEQSLLSM